MKTKKWLLVITLGSVGWFSLGYADGANPVKCIPVPTPRNAFPKPPVPSPQIPHNLP